MLTIKIHGHNLFLYQPRYEVPAGIRSGVIQPGSLPDSSYYTAGVVEFRPNIGGMSSTDMLHEHLQAYIEIINSDEGNATDIIIFPEGTLNNPLQLTYVPEAQQKVIPCQQQGSTELYADFLVQLSCAAQKVRKYVVINLTEKENCTAVNDPRPCATNGLNIYNTNVVFDREGRVVSRYRKVHVYVENKNTTREPELAIFETDFGVRFGHFICFDILFYTPAEELVRRYGVKDFIFTSWFYSELPFLTAVQVQQSWASGNNVNLLAAGASYPQGGITGSGIYAGGRYQEAVMVGGSGIRKLMVAQLPKISTSETTSDGMESEHTRLMTTPRLTAQTGIKLMRDPQIDHFNSQLIDFVNQLNVTRRLCADEFCCNFEVFTMPAKVTLESTFYQYRIGVFNGRRTYEKEEWSDLKICAIYACTNDSVASCGQLNSDDLVEANFVFKSIHIEGDFEKANNLLIMPNSLNEQMYPYDDRSTAWRIVDHGIFYKVQFNTTVYYANVLTFGIYANYYEKSASTIHRATSLPMLLWTVIFTLYIWLALCPAKH